jgi:hypothetical protein
VAALGLYPGWFTLSPMSTPVLHYPDVLNIDHDPGWMEVSLMGSASKRLDVYEQNNRLFEMEKAHQGKPVWELHQAVAVHLQQTLQLAETPSHAVAAKFTEAVLDRIEHVKKKLAGPPTWPAPSPASTPSSSTAPSAPPCSSTSREPSPGDGLLTNLSPIPVSSPS